MDDCVRLGARETAERRAFTDPAHTDRDLGAIRVMLAELRQAVAAPAMLPTGPRPLMLLRLGPEGRSHRVVVCDERRLGGGRDLSLVGFFAEKRLDLDCSPLTAMDDELVGEFPAHPGILSYSSLEFADGNWGNTILLDTDEAREHWRTSDKHAYAAREVAPRYYTVVRLHQGVVPGGLLSGRDPVLLRTRYYDYRGGATWRAEREVRAPRAPSP
jgi:hypothetical protein